MAIIKAVSKGTPSIKGAMNYVLKEEKVKERHYGLIRDGEEITNDSAKAYDIMQETKQMWDKTTGRDMKHFVISFPPGERTHEQCYDYAKEFIQRCPQLQGFDVFVASHEDKETSHCHLIVNSVNYNDGHKLNMSKKDLSQMKELINTMCQELGLSLAQKGLTYEQQERQEITAYDRYTYDLLRQADNGKAQSYVYDIAAKVIEVRDLATTQDQFIALLEERGVGVRWEDGRKNITYIDLDRANEGETKTSIRDSKLEKYFGLKADKVSLTRAFELNMNRTQEQKLENLITLANEREGVNVERYQAEQQLDDLYNLQQRQEELETTIDDYSPSL